MGASSATGPTPNKGYEAAAMQRVGVVLTQLAESLPLAGPTTDLGKAISKAIDALAKVVPAGSVSPMAQRNTIDKMQQQNMQQQQTMQQLKPGGGGSGQQQMPAAA